MKVLHVIETLDPGMGGPPAVAVQLSSGQAGLGHDVTLAYHSMGQRTELSLRSYEWVPNFEKVRRIEFERDTGLRSLYIPSVRGQLDELVAEADVLHLHGVWEPLLWNAAVTARRVGTPYVVRPAGMLDPWSLAQKKIKKKVALMLGFRRMLDNAAYMHSLNRDERDLVSLMGLRCPVEVLPNGVYLESVSGAPPRGTFRAKFPELGDRPFVLFLSRLHYKKGLDYLADAWRYVMQRSPELRLVVSGPDDGAEGEFRQLIKRYNLTDRVVMTGPLYGKDKIAALSDASLFCLPSRQEGFSVAILEALAMGLPVVISEQCHFPEVAEQGVGRVVPLESRAVGDAITQIMSDPELHRHMSVSASEMIARDYTWPQVARKCVQLYETVRRQPGGSGSAARVVTAPEVARGHVAVGGNGHQGTNAQPGAGGQEKLRILHMVRSLDPSAGGPPIVAIKLATAQAEAGHEVHVLAYRTAESEPDVRAVLSQIPNSSLLDLHRLPEPGSVERVVATNAARTARSLLPRIDVIHLHGVWEPSLIRVAAVARQLGVPYVVTPHGMLDPWSLAQKRQKKMLAMWFAVRQMLNEAAFLHLLNSDERDLLKPLGFTSPGELIPNGVFEHEVKNVTPPGTFREAYPELGTSPYILFLSRLHFKKGLDYLAQAFEAIAPRFPDVHLVVAGPDGGARAEFEASIAKAGLSRRVHLVGPIYGRLKTAAMVDADVFCLPSRQEGFSMAITEALGFGCPCVITEPCHFPEVQEVGAGYVTGLNGAEVAEALTKVLSNSAAKQTMGEAGKKLVTERFTWNVIADLAVSFYRKHCPALRATMTTEPVSA